MADDSQPASRPPVNVYTAMLVLSFIAIAVGCIVLALDLGRYNFEIQPPAALRPS
ncbi:MAG: hypothetical protein KGR24_02110 [Planctomycetes bacterium]|jgi:hypothetical protein|nr:hypothetical protein [Planctomycetota bacterium]